MSFTPKQLHFDDDAREKLLAGIEKITKAVSSTLGPMGNTVIIEDPNQTQGMTVTKDGVTVAKSIYFIDPLENLGARMVKDASIKTAEQAGDGTTSAMVLADAIIRSGTSHLDQGDNKTEVLRCIEKIKDEAIAFIKSISEPVNDDDLVKVATISANNDPQIGEIIANAYLEVGKDGVVQVERGDKTGYKVTKGLKFDSGMPVPYFSNDQKRGECILENCSILFTDIVLSDMSQIEHLLQPFVNNTKKSIVIVAEATELMQKVLVTNQKKGIINVCLVNPPSTGWRAAELMEDAAIATGGKFFSEKMGDSLDTLSLDDLGKASKVVVGNGNTVIITDENVDQEVVNERIQQLRESEDEDKKFVEKRIATLSGGIGVVYAGGETEMEVKELYDRMDDAVRAVKSALEEGIIAGAGLPLAHFASIISTDHKDASLKIASSIMAYALKQPLNTILKNADIYYNDDVYPDGVNSHTYGCNVKTGQMCNLIDAGVIDPAKVTRCALQNAVSVAKTILSTNAVVTSARDIE